MVACDNGSAGSWAGAVEALRNRNGVVAVWRGEGEGPGNAALEDQGSVALTSADELPLLILQDRGYPVQSTLFSESEVSHT